MWRKVEGGYGTLLCSRRICVTIPTKFLKVKLRGVGMLQEVPLPDQDMTRGGL